MSKKFEVIPDTVLVLRAELIFTLNNNLRQFTSVLKREEHRLGLRTQYSEDYFSAVSVYSSSFHTELQQLNNIFIEQLSHRFQRIEFKRGLHSSKIAPINEYQNNFN